MRTILSLILFCTALMAKAEAFDFVVAADGSGDYKTIQEAINAVPDYRKKQTKIFVKSGTYKEKVVIPESKIDIKLVGQNRDNTVYNIMTSHKRRIYSVKTKVLLALRLSMSFLLTSVQRTSLLPTLLVLWVKR